MTEIINEYEEIEFNEKERDMELSKSIHEANLKYEEETGRKYDILDSELE